MFRKKTPSDARLKAALARRRRRSYARADDPKPYDVAWGGSIILTAVQIWGLGRNHAHRKTALIPFQDLCAICGLSRTQLYEHLARLVGTGVLRYTNIDGQFTFHLNWEDQSGQTRARPSPVFRTGGALSAVAVSSSREELSPHDKQQHSTHTHAVGGECERGGGASGNPDRASGIPDPASEILDAMGIAEPTRSELLRMAHVTEGYLQKWLAWYASQDRFSPGWAVTHIRDGAPAPRSRRDRQPAGRRAYLAWAANSQ